MFCKVLDIYIYNKGIIQRFLYQILVF